MFLYSACNFGLSFLIAANDVSLAAHEAWMNLMKI